VYESNFIGDYESTEVCCDGLSSFLYVELSGNNPLSTSSNLPDAKRLIEPTSKSFRPDLYFSELYFSAEVFDLDALPY
jgi:hypothetical protein